MSHANGDQFSLRVAGVEHDLGVARLRGRERINALYRFDVEVLTSRRVVAGQRALLGRAAVLKLARPDGSVRQVFGVIAAQGVTGHPAPGDLRRVRLRLVPRMWLTGHRTRSRVFHQMSAVAIVMTVLREWGIDVESRITGRTPTLEHCVQREESDLAFVERVLARHGIAWWFTQHVLSEAQEEGDATSASLGGVTIAEFGADGAGFGRGHERVVLANRAEHYDAIGGASPARLSFVEGREASDERDVSSFSVGSRVRPTSARVSYHLPQYFQPFGGSPPNERADLRTGRGDAPTVEESLGLDLDLHESEHAPYDPNASGARAVLERARADATRARGVSLARELRPGGRFELTDHPYSELNRVWTVTEVSHRADVAEAAAGDASEPAVTYENRFTCVTSSTLVRPRYERPPPRQVVETATVVGTPAEDVYADAVGRIKVRFHWDRRRVRHEDERCCWVRKAEAWAGAGWGAQFTPRPGMEVLVAFLDGDVDRPVIVGALYNEHNQPTFQRDANTRRSGFRTSTIGGEGFNELSFEDLRGREEVFVHAQRDLRARVLRDLDLGVQGDARTTVGGAATTGVEHEASLSVGTDLHVSVQRDLIEEVSGRRASHVAGDRRDDVGGELATSVGGEVRADVGRGLTLRVSGGANVDVGGDDGASVESAGPLRITGRDHITLDAHEGLRIVCGEARIELTRDRVEIVAPTVVVRGDERVEVGTPIASMTLDERVRVRGDEVEVRSEEAALRLTRDAALEGARVHFGSAAATQASGEDTRDEARDEPRTFTVFAPLYNAQGTAPEGQLRVLDGHGETVRVVPASEGREDGGMLFFSLPVEALPDPVEMVFEHGSTRVHIVGPTSPVGTHDALMYRRAAQVANGVARRHRSARRGRP